jgi:hypothetical protein
MVFHRLQAYCLKFGPCSTLASEDAQFLESFVALDLRGTR